MILNKLRPGLILGLFLLTAPMPGLAENSHDANRSHYNAPRATPAPQVDGVADDTAWRRAPWRELKYRWLGPELSDEDFKGRYKVVWTEHRIYLLTEFVDDVLIDTHRDPLQRYWDDDTLEVFIDEDHSGGNHQYNHNAFAYHFSLDNQAIDIGTDKLPHSYSHHTESRWQQHGNKVVWEVSIDIYTDAYRDGATDNQPVVLSAGKVMGFMVAYCDNDGSDIREHFMGSEYAAGDGKDRGWIDAGLFGTLELVD
ncbi:MAG: CBM9 family sugar-binding protein [Halieaceae bacterium]